MQRLQHALLVAFAGIGLLASLVVAGTFFFRKPLLESAARAALKDAAVTVKGLEVRELSPTAIRVEPLELSFAGQNLRFQSVDVRVDSLFPFRLGSVELNRGLVVLDVAQLASLPRTSSSESAELPLPPISAFRGDVSLQMAAPQGTLPLANLKFEFSGGSEALTGVGETASASSQVRLKTRVALDGKAFELGWDRGHVDLAEVLSYWRSLDAGILPGWVLEGAVQLSGQAQSGTTGWSGTTAFVVDGAGAKAERLNVSIKGIHIPGELKFSLPSWQAKCSQPFRIEQIEVAGVLLNEIEGDFSLTESLQLEVKNLSAKAFGGTISLEPFRLDLNTLALRTRLRLSHVSLAAIAKLFDNLGAEIDGRASGEVDFSVSGKKLRFHGGGIVLDRDVPATLRLQQKGILTAGMDQRSLMYPTLLKIETGILNLSIDSLQANLLPEGGPDDVSATIAVAGRPTDAELKSPVNLKVNVRGPLATLMSHLLNQRITK